MMRSIPVLLCTILFLGLGSCTTPSVEGNLCQRTFMPYPDLNPNRIGNRQNDLFIDGMIAYNDKDYAGAVEKLKPFVMKRNSDRSAQLYLACSYLALNKPYDAELALDHRQQCLANVVLPGRIVPFAFVPPVGVEALGPFRHDDYRVQALGGMVYRCLLGL